jgi:hypothetical protein
MLYLQYSPSDFLTKSVHQIGKSRDNYVFETMDEMRSSNSSTCMRRVSSNHAMVILDTHFDVTPFINLNSMYNAFRLFLAYPPFLF